MPPKIDTVFTPSTFEERTLNSNNSSEENNEWTEYENDRTDPTERWQLEFQAHQIDSYEDISEVEKEFMKRWNNFIVENRSSPAPTFYKDVPSLVKKFVRNYRTEFTNSQRHNCLTLFLFGLHEQGLIQPTLISECYNIIDQQEVEDDE